MLQNIVLLNVILPSVSYYAECLSVYSHYAKYNSSDCHCNVFLLNVVVLSVILLGGVLLNAILQNVALLNGILPSFILLNFMIRGVVLLNVVAPLFLNNHCIEFQIASTT
jgi:hypothetical protein